MDQMGGQRIIFDQDQNFRIRVIDPEQFKETQKLKVGSSEFPAEVADFMSSVKEFLDFMENQSKKVEEQKLKSISLRNQVQNEINMRTSMVKELQAQIETRQKNLDKLSTEIRSFEEFERQLQESAQKLMMN